jgi:hypothetical protein
MIGEGGVANESLFCSAKIWAFLSHARKKEFLPAAQQKSPSLS